MTTTSLLNPDATPLPAGRSTSGSSNTRDDHSSNHTDNPNQQQQQQQQQSWTRSADMDPTTASLNAKQGEIVPPKKNKSSFLSFHAARNKESNHTAVTTPSSSVNNSNHNKPNNYVPQHQQQQSALSNTEGLEETAAPNKSGGRLFLFRSTGHSPNHDTMNQHDPNNKSGTSTTPNHSNNPSRQSRSLPGRLRRWRMSGHPTPREEPPALSNAAATTSSLVADNPPALQRQTRVFTVRHNNNKHKFRQNGQHNNNNNSEEEREPASEISAGFETSDALNEQEEKTNHHNCATAILQHSYLELCGSPQGDCFGDTRKGDTLLDNDDDDDDEDEEEKKKKLKLGDDPTVQESIECVFASQLNENLAMMLQQDEDDDEDDDDEKKDEYEGITVEEAGGLVAPSVLQQSLMRNRSERSMTSPNKYQSNSNNNNKSSKKRRSQKKLQESLKLVHVGTYDPNEPSSPTRKLAMDDKVNAEVNTVARGTAQANACVCCRQKTPIVGSDRWPQRPLMLRPTPGSGTVVKGIRKAGSKTEYLWKANSTDISTLTWPEALRQEWDKHPDAWKNNTPSSNTVSSPLETMCPRCMILPVNNGNEAPGDSLVIDFESEIFDGTIMIRIRYSEGTTPQPYSDDYGYFHGMNRRYQTVIQGRFKQEIPFTECMTGFVLDRPCGRLPPKWILKGGLKVLSFFAPQLQARFDSPHPSCLTPLGSTPQVLSIHKHDSTPDIEQMQLEPKHDQNTLLGEASDASATLQRARHRKKHFDKLYTQQSATPVTDTSKIYTMEFLQHLFNFNEFSVDLGSMLGSIKLKEILNGQPLQVLATHKQKPIWSFDIWHESLLEESRIHDQQQQVCEC